jgi:hypothetical protein
LREFPVNNLYGQIYLAQEIMADQKLPAQLSRFEFNHINAAASRWE